MKLIIIVPFSSVLAKRKAHVATPFPGSKRKLASKTETIDDIEQRVNEKQNRENYSSKRNIHVRPTDQVKKTRADSVSPLSKNQRTKVQEGTLNEEHLDKKATEEPPHEAANEEQQQQTEEQDESEKHAERDTKDAPRTPPRVARIATLMSPTPIKGTPKRRVTFALTPKDKQKTKPRSIAPALSMAVEEEEKEKTKKDKSEILSDDEEEAAERRFSDLTRSATKQKEERLKEEKQKELVKAMQPPKPLSVSPFFFFCFLNIVALS